MGAYKVIGRRELEGAAPGDLLTADLDAATEAAYLAAGWVEIVPTRYEVVGPRSVLGNEPGAVFEAALDVGQRDSLIAAGHIAPAKAAKATKSSKGDSKKESK